MRCWVCDVLHHYKWNQYCITWSPWLIIHSLNISNTDKGPRLRSYMCVREGNREKRKKRNVEAALSRSFSSRTNAERVSHFTERETPRHARTSSLTHTHSRTQSHTHWTSRESEEWGRTRTHISALTDLLIKHQIFDRYGSVWGKIRVYGNRRVHIILSWVANLSCISYIKI